jgi:hypothetical protein
MESPVDRIGPGGVPLPYIDDGIFDSGKESTLASVSPGVGRCSTAPLPNRGRRENSSSKDYTMNRKATLAIVSTIFSIASFATTTAVAGPATETHAYLEAERTRTDGKAESTNIERTQAGAPVAVMAQPIAMDAWFEFQRFRTDGNSVS